VPCAGIGEMGFLGLDFLTLHNIVVVRSKISRESKAKGIQICIAG
jgi:hypothetical protein